MDTTDAEKSMAYQHESWLMDKRTWPCLRPGCSGRVDPEDENQWCSRMCSNWSKVHGQEGDKYYKAQARATPFLAPSIEGGMWTRPAVQPVKFPTFRAQTPDVDLSVNEAMEGLRRMAAIARSMGSSP